MQGPGAEGTLGKFREQGRAREATLPAEGISGTVRARARVGQVHDEAELVVEVELGS